MFPQATRHRTERARATVPRIDLAIFVGGLVLAAVAGVVAYRIVGPYGDGPLNVGLYRMRDPETGKQLLYREVRTDDGKVARVLFDQESGILREVRLTFDAGSRRETVG